VSSEFWKEVLSWLKDNDIVIESLTEIGFFLGCFEETEYFFIINMYSVFLLSYRNTRESLGELEKAVDSISRSRKLPLVLV